MDQLQWDELMKELDQYIQKLERASNSVGELFYEAIQPQTIEIFTQYLNGFFEISQMLATVIEHSDLLTLDVKMEVTPLVINLFNQLEEMKGLISQERFVSLADMMNYEIPEKLRQISFALKEKIT